MLSDKYILLNQIDSPDDLKRLPPEKLPELCREIRQYIINTLNRGCSLYHLQGGHSGSPKVEVVSLLTQSEYANLLNYLKENHFDVFITAGNVSEIHGKWHTRKGVEEE